MKEKEKQKFDLESALSFLQTRFQEAVKELNESEQNRER